MLKIFLCTQPTVGPLRRELGPTLFNLLGQEYNMGLKHNPVLGQIVEQPGYPGSAQAMTSPTTGISVFFPLSKSSHTLLTQPPDQNIIAIQFLITVMGTEATHPVTFPIPCKHR